ncbi:MAG: hypothetical protein ACJA0M_000696 [Chitinophagales bacterium]|jgi:hypothetical protein
MTETGRKSAKLTTYTQTKLTTVSYIMVGLELLHTSKAGDYITLAWIELPPRPNKAFRLN